MSYKSQYRQDYWVSEIVFPTKRNGTFLDVGAHDGVWLSNTHFLEQERGWGGLLIEADPRCFARLEKNRSSKAVQVCLDACDGYVQFYIPNATDGLGGIAAQDTDSRPERLQARRAAGQTFEIRKMIARTLTSVLDESELPTHIDYMSIDIEGAELRAFKGLDLNKYSFGALTIERPNSELRKMLSKHGYRNLGQLVHDSLFVHADLEDIERVEFETLQFASSLRPSPSSQPQQ